MINLIIGIAIGASFAPFWKKFGSAIVAKAIELKDKFSK